MSLSAIIHKHIAVVIPVFSCFIVLLCCTCSFATGATDLPDYEVEALKDIAKTLKKTTGWDFNNGDDPCEDFGIDRQNNAVSCDDSISGDNVTHVVAIVLKSQSLPGTLPAELVRLPYLQEFDVTGNYLSGTIPSEWGSMAHLEKLSVMENRLTGPIPKEIGKISTLQSFVVESNELSGDLPPELGNLTQLQRLFVNTNKFTGELPTSFAKLTNLTDLWLSDNRFNGTIPAFIQNFTNLNRLVIQGSGLQGPIPPGIGALKNLIELRISDLGGEEAEFPQLGNNINMTRMILRNCNLIGVVPDFLGTLTNLQTMDISFNKLTGPLSSTFDSLTSVSYMYLTSNQFTGPMSNSFLTTRNYIDLSYNNLTIEKCPVSNVNIFKGSPESNNSGEVSCLKGLQCQARSGSLFINCGGPAVDVNGVQYVADDDPGSPSKFFDDEYSWAYSSTGYFIDNSNKITYISSNTTELSMENPQLYTRARLTPITLTYYAYCLVNGTYTVKLHFVEIMFTNGVDYRSLGRRIFNVYIQGKLVLQDFNIVDEAKGAGKLIIKEFKDITVTNGTLEIRFYWAGKGTRYIPDAGVYGPLISAISIDSRSNENKISAGAIAGIVAAVVFVIILISVFRYWRCFFKHESTMEEDLKGVDLHTGTFALRRIKAATNNFDDTNKIGEGGFGPVYKGILSDGRAIAVKQLSSKSRQGNREFVNEIAVISALQHPNLVKLYGCCIDGNQLLLVYEYLENNSLSRALFGSKENQLKLDWRTRNMICIGIARGLAYLHEGSSLKIVHRDIKASNVLLDGSFNPKISDFGLAKLDEEDKTHISTRVAGTYGYMAPEYAMQGILTEKADVYSFGILALEIVSGQSNSAGILRRDGFFVLLDWARALKACGDLMQLIDPRLGSDYNEEEVIIMTDIALLCTCASPVDRPSLSSVLSMLEGKTTVPRFVLDSKEFTINSDEMEAIRKHFRGIETYVDVVDETRRQSSQTSAKLTGSKQNEGDPYPFNSNSFTWPSSD